MQILIWALAGCGVLSVDPGDAGRSGGWVKCAAPRGGFVTNYNLTPSDSRDETTRPLPSPPHAPAGEKINDTTRPLRLLRNKSVKNPFAADTLSIGSLDPLLDLESGRRIDVWPDDYFVAAKSPANDGTPDDCLLNDWGIPIFSNRLKLTLRDAGIDGIQYLPIRVIRPDQSEVEGFEVANITSVVAALDYNRSEFYGKRPPVGSPVGTRVRRYVLRADALEGVHIFRLAEAKTYIFVSGSFVENYRKGQFTPWGFTPALTSGSPEGGRG